MELLVEDAYESNKPMLNHIFFYIPSESIKDFHSTFPDIGYVNIQKLQSSSRRAILL